MSSFDFLSAVYACGAATMAVLAFKVMQETKAMETELEKQRKQRKENGLPKRKL